MSHSLNTGDGSCFFPLQILFEHSKNPAEKRNLEYLCARFHGVINCRTLAGRDNKEPHFITI